jgi:hypothetical protein
MAFTKALFYPTIDIPEENWLMSAILYWDEIQTIVPRSIDNPYQNKVTKKLHDLGYLKPFEVNPNHRLVEDLSETVMKYINEASNFLIDSKDQNTHIHTDKLPREFRIHPEKLPYVIRHIIESNIDEDGWFRTNSEFGSFYMSLLANKICEDKSLALLTDNSIASNLTEQARLDSKIQVNERDYYRRNERTTLNLAQGLLTNLIIKGVKIAPNTKIETILKFKKDYKDELGLFRSNLLKLVKDLNKDNSLDAIQQQVKDIYTDEFLPSLHDLEKSLDGAKIKWFSDTLLKVALITTGATAFLPAMLGLTVPQALLAGAGISIFATKVLYNQDKAEKIRKNPYSYLLSVEKEFKKTSMKNIIM